MKYAYLGLRLRNLKVLLTLKKNPFEEKNNHLIKKLKALLRVQKT
jgi:hypothetical protein